MQNDATVKLVALFLFTQSCVSSTPPKDQSNYTLISSDGKHQLSYKQPRQLTFRTRTWGKSNFSQIGPTGLHTRMSHNPIALHSCSPRVLDISTKINHCTHNWKINHCTHNWKYSIEVHNLNRMVMRPCLEKFIDVENGEGGLTGHEEQHHLPPLLVWLASPCSTTAFPLLSDCSSLFFCSSD